MLTSSPFLKEYSCNNLTNTIEEAKGRFYKFEVTNPSFGTSNAQIYKAVAGNNYLPRLRDITC